MSGAPPQFALPDRIGTLHSVSSPAVPINFVCVHPERWPSFFQDAQPRIELTAHNVSTHEDCMIIQPYAELQQAGLEVELSTAPRPDAINLISSIDFQLRDWRRDCFFLASQADWIRPRIANSIIAINPVEAERYGDFAPAFFPQTAMIPRDPTRENVIRSLAFFGVETNLGSQFREPSFATALEQLGVKFTVRGFDPVSRTSDWHDYSDVDAVLAIRSLPAAEIRLKPELKLINAWVSGTVGIFGPEPAYQHLRTSPFDFIEASTAEQVIEAIRTVNENPGEFDKRAARARERAVYYQKERVIQRWIAMLEGPASDQFREFQQTGMVSRCVRFASNAALQRADFELHRRRQSSRTF